MRLKAKIKNNTIVVDRTLMHIFCSQYKDGTDVEIRKVAKIRSTKENSYYHGVVIKILSDELGLTPEEMHEALRLIFLIESKNGLQFTKSTTQLLTHEFEHYLSEIRQWASLEFNIYIPLPNEYDIAGL